MLSSGTRLSASSTLAVPTSDLTSVGTIYSLPYSSPYTYLRTSSGTWVRRYVGSSGSSLALTITSGSNYDVFEYWDATTGTVKLALSSAWTNGTTRADAISRQDGVWVLSSDKTRRYKGTIRASGSNVTEDSIAKRFVWNVDNRIHRVSAASDSTSFWTTTSTSLAAMNGGDADWKFEFLFGLQEDGFFAVAETYAEPAGGDTAWLGIGLDSSSANSGHLVQQNTNGAVISTLNSGPLLGYHYVQALQKSGNGGTTTYYGGGRYGQMSNVIRN